MLRGIRSNEIIVGAYTDGDGGVCPMLAAHRAGGRTSFIGFARAWDRFAQPGKRARRATERELLILTSQLEVSLLEEHGPAPDLAQAVAEHRDLLARHAPRAARQPAEGAGRSGGERAARPGDRDRSGELRHRPGWSWLHVFRRYDDYERALERLRAENDALAQQSERELVR